MGKYVRDDNDIVHSHENQQDKTTAPRHDRRMVPSSRQTKRGGKLYDAQPQQHTIQWRVPVDSHRPSLSNQGGPSLNAQVFVSRERQAHNPQPGLPALFSSGGQTSPSAQS